MAPKRKHVAHGILARRAAGAARQPLGADSIAWDTTETTLQSFVPNDYVTFTEYRDAAFTATPEPTSLLLGLCSLLALGAARRRT